MPDDAIGFKPLRRQSPGLIRHVAEPKDSDHVTADPEAFTDEPLRDGDVPHEDTEDRVRNSARASRTDRGHSSRCCSRMCSSCTSRGDGLLRLLDDRQLAPEQVLGVAMCVGARPRMLCPPRLGIEGIVAGR